MTYPVCRTCCADLPQIRLGNGVIVSTRDELLDEIERAAPGARGKFAEGFDLWARAGLDLGEIFDRFKELAK